MIPVCDLRRQYESLKPEIDAAMQGVAADGRFILGPNVKELEGNLARYCQTQHAAGVASGTDALHLVLRALRIGPGDEVITTPFTFVATTEAIGIVGATPVFVDIQPETFNMDPAAVEAAITPRTRAILPVHLYGQPCDMKALQKIAQKHDVELIEDCAQALGAEFEGRKIGSFGVAGCLSFFPSKNLGCFGDGGMVVSNDDEVYQRVEMLRRHGGKVKYHHAELGLNSRLDDLQAAILRVKLPHLELWNSQRRRLAYRYNRLLANVDEVACPAELDTGSTVIPEDEHAGSERVRAVYHQYTIRVPQRDAVGAHLQKAGVGNMVYYPVPLHLQEVHANLGLKQGSFPHAEQAAAECLSLPMFPELTEEEQQTVVAAVRAAVAATRPSLRRSA